MAFITTWKTDNEGEGTDYQVKIPTVNGYGYNCTVNWGDGNTDTITTWNDSKWTHTYASIGTYDITITGTFGGWAFGGSDYKLLDVKQWGSEPLHSCYKMFLFCSSITTFSATNKPNLSQVTNMVVMFYGSSINADIGDWDVSNVTNMGGMFQQAENFNQNIGSWDVSSVTDMSSMFMYARLFNQDIGGWDVSSVANMNYMFYDANDFNQDLSTWCVESILTKPDYFDGDAYKWVLPDSRPLWGEKCPMIEGDFVTTWKTDNIAPNSSTNVQVKIPTVDGYGYNCKVKWGDGKSDTITTWNDSKWLHSYTSKGTYDITITGTFGGWMFNVIDSEVGNNYGEVLKLLDVKQWGSSPLKSCHKMFFGTKNLNISAINTPDLSQVTDMSQMFDKSSINNDIGNWNVSGVTNMRKMFFWAQSFNKDISSWDVSKVTDMSGMFNRAFYFNQNISSWDVSKVTNMSAMFSNANAFNQNISSWYVNRVTDMSFMFSSANAFNQNIGSWDVSNVDNMSSMFQDASIFNQNISGWDVSRVTNMSYMFQNASVFNQNIGSWDVNSVTDMSGMFRNAKKFNKYINNWKVSRVTDMSYMFHTASIYNQDIGKWDTSKVTNMSYMFQNASVFNQNIGSWDVSSVANMDNMFLYASKFNRNLINWCVELITSKPEYFDYQAYSWTLSNSRPLWGVKCIIDIILPPSFCEVKPFKIRPNVCGKDNGHIRVLNEIYFELYDIVLTDVDGNIYPYIIDTYNNLPTGFYSFTATPKSEYWGYYGRDACTINWIPIHPSDTSITLDSVSIRPKTEDEDGRLVITITDIYVDAHYDVWIYNNKGELVKSILNTTSKQYVIEGCQCYYIIIVNKDNGCGLTLGEYCIPSESRMSHGGLKHVFIAPSETVVDINYWKSSDEGFYLETLDPSFFFSTKIKSIETILQWYSLPIHNGQASFKQKLTKSRQGIGFIDTLNIAIAAQNVQKLEQLMMLFGKKFVIIVQDNNMQWWCSGYKIPAELKISKMLTGGRNETNEYQLEFESISSDNIITSIDEQWVKDNIL